MEWRRIHHDLVFIRSMIERGPIGTAAEEAHRKLILRDLNEVIARTRAVDNANTVRQMMEKPVTKAPGLIVVGKKEVVGHVGGNTQTRSCSYKAQHKTMGFARISADEKTRDSGETHAAYKCDYCPHFHVGKNNRGTWNL